MEQFHNVYEAVSVMGIERDERPTAPGLLELASHKLYRHSPRGFGLHPLDAAGNYMRNLDASKEAFIWGIAITGIVEGADIEGARKLMFPFTAKDFWAACDALDDELSDGEAEWNAQGDE